MRRRLTRDESGMTMALALMMIVLIGVMGAGLLVFVQNDLKSVIEENRGQKALDIAEAGVQAAKAHLRVDSFRQHYDTDRANDCAEGPRVGGDNWSKATLLYTDPDGYCVGTTGLGSTRTASQVGVTKNFGGGKFQVTIECFVQGTETAASSPCQGGATNPDGTLQDPPNTTDADQTKFFKVTSTGYDTTLGDGAIRKVEAIYTTVKRTYAPVAYWTPRNILFTGTPEVRKMSFFAGENITGVRKSGPGTTIADPRPGPDAVYTDWLRPPYNTTGRMNGTVQIRDAGFGAVKYVCGPTSLSNCNSNPTANRLPPNAKNDYDSLTTPKFVAKPTTAPQSSSEITFPFDPRNTLGPSGDPRDIVDSGLVEEMRAAADLQDNYQVGPGDISTWPAQGAIHFVNAQGATIEYTVPKSWSVVPKGVLVIENGNFGLAANSKGFEGVVIVIGDGASTGTYSQRGSAQLDGYVAASGNIDIRGNVNPNLSVTQIENLNTFLDVQLWSWRELYE